MVNSTGTTNLAQAISLSTLLGGSTINANQPATSDLTSFKDLITNLMNKELSADRVQLAIDTASNDKVKAALYQAASVMHLMGSIQNVASMDLENISKDMIAANVMQENNLNPAERQLFVKGLKLTAIEITASEAAVNNTLSPLPLNQPSNTTSNTASNIIPAISTATNSQPINTLSGAVTIPPAASAAVTTGNGLVPATIQTSAALNVSPIATAPASVSGGVVVSTDRPVVNTPQAIPAQSDNNRVINVDTIGSSVAVNTPALKSAVDQLDTLVLVLKDLLARIISNHYDAVKGDEKDSAEKKIANSALDRVKAQVEDIKATLKNGEATQATQAKIEQAIKEIMSSLNTIVMMVEKMVIAGVAINGVPDNAADAKENGEKMLVNTVISPLNNNGQDDGQAKKYTVTTSNNTDEFDALMNKIVTLLNEMNGKLEVSEKLAYIPVKPAAVPEPQPETTQANQPNNNTVIINETKPQVVVTNTYAAPAVQDKVVVAQQETGKAQIITVPAGNNGPDAGAKLAVKSASVQTVMAPEAPEAVTFTGAEISTASDNTFDSSTRSLVKDIQWVSDNIIKPAAKSEADSVNALSTVVDKAMIFSKAADFAVNIKDQVIMRQVTDSIQNMATQAVKINEISMVLKPENLGYVYIRIEHKDDKLKANIQVLNNDVKDTLKANLPELKAALNSIGLKLDSFDISTANQNINSGLNDQAKNPFKEWEGAALLNQQAELEPGIDPYVSADGYLNYLA